MTEHSLLDRLDWLQSRFEEVSTLIASPDAVSDMKRYVRLNKEYRDLEQIVLARREYLQLINNINEAKALLEHERRFSVLDYLTIDEFWEQYKLKKQGITNVA
jgi:peptide chain release factor 1